MILVSDRKFLLLLIATFLALQLPFVPTAFRVDEPTFIRLGQQAERSPADPYGFQINWLGLDEEAFHVLANPPGVPLWLAAAGRTFGWSETSLHLSMLPFGVLALVGIWILAGELGVDRRAAALLTAVSPAFFLGSQVVMPDVAMLAMMNLAVGLALRYRRTGSGLAAALGGLCGSLAPVVKYNGVIAGAVVGVIWILSKERRRGLVLLAAAPALGLAAWSVWSLAVYGRAHVLVMAEFQGEGITNIFSAMVAYVGLAMLPLAVAAPGLPDAGSRRIVNAATLGGFALMWAGAWLILGFGPWAALAYGLSAAVAFRYGMIGVELAASWLRARDRDGLVLIAWAVIGIWFQFGLLFSSARYLLPLLPPALLMILRARLIDSRSPWFRVAVAVSAALALAIAIGDARLANLSRDFVREVVVPERARYEGRFFFDGHWGFQYYCEEAGGRSLNFWKQEKWRDGDFVAIAMNPFPEHTRPQPGRGIRFESRGWKLSPHWPVRTIDCAVPANFYGPGLRQCRGPALPWGFATGPSDTFELFVATERVRGDARAR